MSDSSSSGRNSPEQGEVKSSPEHTYRGRGRDEHHEEKEHLSLSPHSQEALDDDKDERDVIEIPSDDGDAERDALNIKPPQSQAGAIRSSKPHKHKHKAERRREKQRQARDRERDSRDRYRHAASGSDHRSEKSDSKDRGLRGYKDAREIVRERQKEKEKLKRPKESPREDWDSREAAKRKESLKERERLEMMERERQRERRLREERERADKQRRKEEERRMQQRGEEPSRRDKSGRRDRSADRSSERSDPSDRDRGRNKDQRRRGDRDKSDIRGQDRDRENKQSEQRDSKGTKGPRTPEVDYRSGEHDAEMHSEEEHESSREGGKHDEESHEEEPGSPHPAADSEEEENKTPEQESNSSNEDSDSGSSNSGSSRGHSSEEEKKRKAHVRSKFDEEEQEESNSRDPHSASRSPESADGHADYIQDTPPQSPIEMADELPIYLPAIQGCRSVEEFHCLNRIEEGTFGVVYRARDKKTNEIVALKRLKMEKEKEGFPITSLREINTLLKAQHTNIVTVREIVVGSNMDKIYIVMDYVEHDLKSLMETMKSPFLVGEVKTLMKQLLRAVAHLHDNWILHRDLKTSNLLLSHKGILKVGDFGLAREYGSPLKQYTPIVVTLWYRAPELLLGIKEYSCPIDMWSVGCIFAEFLTLKALWPGKSEIDQINRIFKDLGTPNEKIWSGVMELPGMKKCTFTNYPYNSLRNRFGSVLSDTGFDLLNRFLTYDPQRRSDAKTALEHKYFLESPLPVDPSMFPTWPARSEQTGRKHASSPKPPSGGKAYAMLMDDEENLTAGGFHMSTSMKGASAQGTGFQLKF